VTIDKIFELISSLFPSYKALSFELWISKIPEGLLRIFKASEGVESNALDEVRAKYLPRLLKYHVLDLFFGIYNPRGSAVVGSKFIPIIFSLDQVVFTPLTKYL
jgi:hypothetical protein